MRPQTNRISSIDLGWDRLERALGHVVGAHLDRLDIFQRDGVEPEEAPEDTELMIRTITGILLASLPGTRGRRWNLGGVNALGIGCSIDLEESQTKARACYGFRGTGFSLSLSLDRAEYLGRTRDSFWVDLASLAGLGQFTFEPSAIPRPLWKSTARMTGRLNHAIGDILRFWRLHHEEPDPFMDFGSLDVSWPLETPLPDLTRSLGATLEVFYRISYELYRLERQTRAGKALRQE